MKYKSIYKLVAALAVRIAKFLHIKGIITQLHHHVLSSYTSGLELDALSFGWPAVGQLVVFFNPGSQWV